jgi:chromosome condensin MukBEF MukE localization factor
MKARLGKCIMFGGMNTAAVEHASGALKMLSREWRELVAGREGFLTARQRAGLLRHKVVWGEQDCMVCLSLCAWQRNTKMLTAIWG